MKKVLILGASGSIGHQALAVIHESDELELVGASVHTNWRELVGIKHAHQLKAVYASDAAAAQELAAALPGDVQRLQSIDELIEACEPDIVLNAIVGFAGLAATLTALQRGIDVALANKESLVSAGRLCMETAQRFRARILPVDSEHSAIFQCLGSAVPRDDVASLVLTASGGPFYGMQRSELELATVDQALNHPTWKMGGKISIDSATLMNKGLEIMEAHVLFGVAPEDIEVVVHRHSIVHSLVRHVDGSLLAHFGWPDMKVPIAWALNWPTRYPVHTRHLDLTQMPPLEFHKPDVETFRCLALAREATSTGGSAPLVLNAANEVAVGAFLAGEIGFLQIADHVESVLNLSDIAVEVTSLEHAQELDSQARVAVPVLSS